MQQEAVVIDRAWRRAEAAAPVHGDTGVYEVPVATDAERDRRHPQCLRLQREPCCAQRGSERYSVVPAAHTCRQQYRRTVRQGCDACAAGQRWEERPATPHTHTHALSVMHAEPGTDADAAQCHKQKGTGGHRG